MYHNDCLRVFKIQFSIVLFHNQSVYWSAPVLTYFGLSQNLCLYLAPVPHDLLHDVISPQLDHAPSTCLNKDRSRPVSSQLIHGYPPAEEQTYATKSTVSWTKNSPNIILTYIETEQIKISEQRQHKYIKDREYHMC